MKKTIRLCLLLGLILIALCVTAAAAEPTVAGIYNKAVETEFSSKVTVTPKDSSGTEVTNDSGCGAYGYQSFYQNAVMLSVTYTNATSGDNYMIFVTDAEGAPTESSLVYINQITASSATICFDSVYPGSLLSGKTYYVYLSGTGLSYTKIASFHYFAPYKLGDVNDDTYVDTDDALLILRSYVGTYTLTDKQKQAADVNRDKLIDTDDALLVLRYYVGTLPSLG